MRPIKITLAAAAAAALMLLASCTGAAPPPPSESASPSTPAEAGVVLSVPPTRTAGEGVQLVVESHGHPGTAKLYAFVVGFDEKTTCTDTEVTATEVTLTEGRQTVQYTGEGVGDVWFVLTGDGWSTPCGAPGSVMRSLFVTRLELGVTQKEGKVGQPFEYAVFTTSAPPKPVKEWDTKISWYGPYATAPEAQGAGCDGEPVAITAEAKITKAYNPNDYSGKVALRSSPAQAGVYRLVAEITETKTTARVATDCQTAPLVVIS